MALNDREKLFADEYIKLGNAYQAALNAGYAKSTAKDASKWLIPDKNPKKPDKKSKYKPEICAFIDERMAEKEKELIAEQDEILKYLTSVMRGQSRSSVLARDETGADRVIEKPPDEKERTKAAELLGKRYALFTEKVEQDVDMELNITIDYGDDDEDDEDDEEADEE